MNMKTIMMVLAVMVFSVGNVSAKHHGEDHAKKMEMRHEKMSKELNLTAEQKTKAKEIRIEGRKEMKPLMMEMKSLRKKMDKIRAENKSEFEEILTPEQKEKFATIKKNKKGCKKHCKKHKHNEKDCDCDGGCSKKLK